eukprot:14075399-Alexandrium_andersonii.AAC.1
MPQQQRQQQPIEPPVLADDGPGVVVDVGRLVRARAYARAGVTTARRPAQPQARQQQLQQLRQQQHADPAVLDEVLPCAAVDSGRPVCARVHVPLEEPRGDSQPRPWDEPARPCYGPRPRPDVRLPDARWWLQPIPPHGGQPPACGDPRWSDIGCPWYFTEDNCREMGLPATGAGCVRHAARGTAMALEPRGGEFGLSLIHI